MADQNPMHDWQVVPLNLPAQQIAILLGNLKDWIDGLHGDLSRPERLRDPDGSRRQAEAFERLLVGVAYGIVVVPDEDARAALESTARGYDEANEYEGIVAEHDALHGLLERLEAEAG
jgi:hypothetical protein